MARPNNPYLEKGGEHAPFMPTGGGGGGGAPSGPAGGALAGEYPNPAIAANAIGEAQVSAGAITAAKLAANAVGEAQVQAGAISLAKLAEAVSNLLLGAGRVTSAMLAANLLQWENVEAVNAGVEQTVAIQCARLGNLVILRGLGKIIAEVAAKGTLFSLTAACIPGVERHFNLVTTLTTTAQTAAVKATGQVENSTVLAIGKVLVLDGVIVPV